MIQLNPPLPMITPKGEGFAHILLDYGPESDLYWTVLITATGEIWTFANHQVRAGKNITLGRTHVEDMTKTARSGPAITAAKPAKGEKKLNGSNGTKHSGVNGH